MFCQFLYRSLTSLACIQGIWWFLRGVFKISFSRTWVAHFSDPGVLQCCSDAHHLELARGAWGPSTCSPHFTYQSQVLPPPTAGCRFSVPTTPLRFNDSLEWPLEFREVLHWGLQFYLKGYTWDEVWNSQQCPLSLGLGCVCLWASQCVYSEKFQWALEVQRVIFFFFLPQPPQVQSRAFIRISVSGHKWLSYWLRDWTLCPACCLPCLDVGHLKGLTL